MIDACNWCVFYREMAERRRETGDDRPLDELYDVVPAGASANPPLDRKDSACSDTEREVSKPL